MLRLPLKIKPVKLNRSIYVRVPNDIADLIGIDREADIALRVQDSNGEFLLIYSIRKPVPVPLKPVQEADALHEEPVGDK